MALPEVMLRCMSSNYSSISRKHIYIYIFQLHLVRRRLFFFFPFANAVSNLCVPLNCAPCERWDESKWRPAWNVLALFFSGFYSQAWPPVTFNEEFQHLYAVMFQATLLCVHASCCSAAAEAGEGLWGERPGGSGGWAAILSGKSCWGLLHPTPGWHRPNLPAAWWHLWMCPVGSLNWARTEK